MIVVAVSLCLIYVWVLYLIQTAPTEDELYGHKNDNEVEDDNDNKTKFED